MFKKHATLKPASPLRSSARRAFIAHLQALYPALAGATTETLQAIVPVGLKQCGATTSTGHRAVLYTDEAGKPFWFEVGHDAGAALQQSQEKRKGKGGDGANGKKTGSSNVKTIAKTLAEVIPTVYALWVLPNLLPRLPTWPQIVDPVLLSGSALMVPGLIPAPHTFPEEVQRYEVYAREDEALDVAKNGEDSAEPAASKNPVHLQEVRVHDRPIKSGLVAITPYPSQVPLVIARLEISIDEIVAKRMAGEKGKAATTIHAVGDQLWELGGKESAPKEEDIAALNTQISKAPDGQIQDVSVAQNEIAKIDLADTDASQEMQAPQTEQDHTKDAAEPSKDTASEAAFVTSEVDAILHLALLRALSSLAKQPSALPLPVSAFYSTHVLPNRPAHWPPRDVKGRRPARLPPKLWNGDSDAAEERIVDADGTDVRHSSAKKLSKWVRHAEKTDLFKTKEMKGKDTVLTSINTGHPDLKLPIAYQTISDVSIKSEDATGEANGAVPAGALGHSNVQKAAKTSVVIERFWRATSSGVQLFQEMGCSVSEPLSRPVIKSYLLDYIGKKQLADPRNQSLIRIRDPLLTHALYPKAPLNEIPAALRREDILERILSKSCQEFHRTSRLLPGTAARVLMANTKGTNDGDTDGRVQAGVLQPDAYAGERVGQMNKGPAQPIKIDIKTRQGRKVISLITSLEVYDIDAEAFSNELMRIAGAASSTSQLPGSTAKHPKCEIFIQGDQRKIIFELLESQHGIDRRFVQVNDMTKK